jgi:aerobic-type carbon monoxide dehydrogenase small subunit (CoxS/CutS family)
VSEHRIRFTVNGKPFERAIPADRFLIDLLRDDLALTGTKEGCGIGVCGLCSVIVDGALTSACILPAVLIDGAKIETVEGLEAKDGALSPLQDAFITHGGFQCGICTPGQLISATALLRENARPSAAETKAWMMGNLCRCTGYEGIAKAIASVAGPGVEGTKSLR